MVVEAMHLHLQAENVQKWGCAALTALCGMCGDDALGTLRERQSAQPGGRRSAEKGHAARVQLLI